MKPNQPSAKSAASSTSSTPPASRKRAHSINSITLEVNAAEDLRSHRSDTGEWATVFAIHNKWHGAESDPNPIPISVKFGGNTIAYAKTAIKKGTTFTVVGEIDYSKSETGKEFYRINANQLRVNSRKPEDAE